MHEQGGGAVEVGLAQPPVELGHDLGRAPRRPVASERPEREGGMMRVVVTIGMLGNSRSEYRRRNRLAGSGRRTGQRCWSVNSRS